MKHAIIDSHQHFWKYDPIKHDWISKEMAVIRRNFDGEMSARLMKESGVTGVVAVQADQSESETEYLLTLADNHPHILGVVGWVDLRAPNVDKRLKYFSQYEKLKGFRHVVQDEQDPEFMLKQPFLNGVTALFEYGFTYDILIYSHQLPMAIEFVKRFPEMPIVLDHLAKPDIKNRIQHPWKEWLAELAGFPNVYVKLSGLVTEADWKHWQPNDFNPYLMTALKYFSPKRCMFGSDYPVCTLAASYQQIKAIIDSVIEELTQEEQEWIWSQTAQTFYQLSQ